MSHQAFHGLLLINKDKNCTSHQVVYQIRKLLKQKAIGHAGTLDPMATGLLVMLCGSATKLSSYFLNENKRYELSLKFGVETDTFDIQGQVLKSKPVDLNQEDIRSLLQQETRELEIPVPIFSAVKIKGRKLYDYAFKGETIKLPLKKMSFWDLKIEKLTKDSASLSVSCSKGSYIRSWVHYLGQKIQTGACLTSLNRVSSGSFNLKESVSTAELEKLLSQKFPQNEQELKQCLESSFIFPNLALKDFSQIELTGYYAKLLRYGRLAPYLLEASQKEQIQTNKTGQVQIIKAVRKNKLLALLELKPYKKLKILKNLN